MFVDVMVEEDSNVKWRLAGMYGEFRWEHKYKTWERIRRLHQINNSPWLLSSN